MAEEQDICGLDSHEWMKKVVTVLDPLLVEVWRSVWLTDEETGFRNSVSFQELGGLLRLAYVQGYKDAHEEPVAGELFRLLGVAEPAVTKQRRSKRRPR